MQNLHNILNNLKKQDQQNYGIAVFDIDLKVTKKGIMLFGEVLTENQKSQILKLAKNKKIKIAFDKIKILSDSSKRHELGWAIVKDKMIDLKLRFVSNKILNKKILKKIRCSQAFKSEILRVLYKNEDQLLVQQNDLTLGWVDRGKIVIKKKSLYKEWKKGNFAVKGKVIKILKINCHSEFISESIVDFKKNNTTRSRKKISEKIKYLIIKEAEKYLGTKYLLGGKTKKGIDCSGLVQVAYKNSLDIILPKHSWDQKEMGKKVNLKNVISGDLIFLIKKENSHKHVGIVEVVLENNAKRPHINTPPAPLKRGIGTMEPAAVNLIHASLEKKKVIRQSLEKVFENYDFVEAGRIVE